MKEEIFRIAYEESNKLGKGEIDKETAIRNIVKAGWSEGNAKITFHIFNSLMNGEVYSRSMTISQTKIFLDSIFKEYKCPGLTTALKSVKIYLEYYKQREGKENIGIKKVYQEYIEILKEHC